MATLSNKGVEAWWGFLAGAIIAIAVGIGFLILTGKIKLGTTSTISWIGDKIGEIFK
jgi:hypothetical protein